MRANMAAKSMYALIRGQLAPLTLIHGSCFRERIFPLVDITTSNAL